MYWLESIAVLTVDPTDFADFMILFWGNNITGNDCSFHVKSHFIVQGSLLDARLEWYIYIYDW